MAMRRAAARSGEWAQHFSNASCFIHIRRRLKVTCSFSVCHELKVKYSMMMINDELDLLCDVPDVASTCNPQQLIVDCYVVYERKSFVTKDRIWNPDLIQDVCNILQFSGTRERKSCITPHLSQIHNNRGRL